MIGTVYAQAAPGPFDALNSLIVPTVLIIGIMYFLMIRPQQKRLKEHQAMIGGLRRGDTVVTGAGERQSQGSAGMSQMRLGLNAWPMSQIWSR